jgi:hypothetical protein
VSHTYLEVPVIVFEMWPGHVGEEEQVPSQFNRRARIFRARVPPDQLHPEGGTHAELSMFMPTQGVSVPVYCLLLLTFMPCTCCSCLSVPGPNNRHTTSRGGIHDIMRLKS